MFATSATEPALTAPRILGIDPGLRITGFGVIEQSEQGPWCYVASGVIKIPDGMLADRLAHLFNHLSEVIRTYEPHRAAVEKVFVNVNPQSTLLLGQARGAALCALAVAGLPVAEYTALQIKQAVVGHGHATKEQIQAMMMRLLALPGLPSRDAADALACASCHAQSQTAMKILQSGLAAVPLRGRATRPSRGLRRRHGRMVHP